MRQATDWQSVDLEALIRCEMLASILAACLVPNGYKPPVPLTSQLRLSRRGTQLANQAKGSGVSLPEAQMAVFLTIWSGDELAYRSQRDGPRRS